MAGASSSQAATCCTSSASSRRARSRSGGTSTSSNSGLRRAAAQSGRQQFGQSQTAAAKADYSAPGGGTLTLAIVDAGNYSGILSLAFNAGKVLREDGSSYTRKVVYRDCSGVEGYDNASRSGSVQILAAQRFLVKSSGRGIEDKALLAALDALDLDALGRLAR